MKHPQYNENQFKLQSKHSVTSLQKPTVVKQAGSITSRNNELGVINRERSYTNEKIEEDKSRERSVSNISNKQISKTTYNSNQASVRSTINS